MRAWRAAGRTVAVLAVDPSSKRSGGSLLGDRARIAFDPADGGVFIRSTAAGEQLGGLAPATRAAAHALAAAFDVVVIETVGVGQSETDVADVADTVAVVVQPGSGDVLQFLKAGDHGDPRRARRHEGRPRPGRAARRGGISRAGPAARSARATRRWSPSPRCRRRPGSTSSSRRSARTGPALDLPARRLQARRRHALADFAAEHGARGLRSLGGRRAAERWLDEQDPALEVPALVAALEARARADA